MTAGRLVASIGLTIGLLGLGLDAWVIMNGPAVTAMGQPTTRSAVGQFIYFWAFFTHLSNLGLLLVYLSEWTGTRALAWLRHPIGRASMAANITLVMVFFHVLLAPHFHFTGLLLVSNTLLHYVAPTLYLVWWLAFTPHGTLRLRDIPVMLTPGVIYVVLVMVRGALTTEYPYAVLDPSMAGYGTVTVSILVILVSVAVFCLVLVGLDRLLGRRTASAT